MGTKTELLTHIKLNGANAERFLAGRGILDITQQDTDGNFVVGEIEGNKGYTLLGETDVKFILTQTDYSTNHEVALRGSWVKGGKNRTRKLPFRNDEATERRVSPPQEFTGGVNIFVETNAPVTVFKKNAR